MNKVPQEYEPKQDR